jgi:cytochrome oxidase Cu insertion factor (SCO1/SenC/PrrC family)
LNCPKDFSVHHLKLLSVLFSLSTSLLFSQSVDTAKVIFTPDSLLNKPAPYFSGKSMKGTDFSSENFKGKVTLINFWFLGCQPCMREIPYLNEIDSIYSGNNFQVISIASNSKSDLISFVDTTKRGIGASHRKWHKIKSIRYEIIPACKKNGVHKKSKYNYVLDRGCNDIARDYFVSGMPVTYIIDVRGIIRYVHEGFCGFEESCDEFVKEYYAEIDKLLNE